MYTPSLTMYKLCAVGGEVVQDEERLCITRRVTFAVSEEIVQWQQSVCSMWKGCAVPRVLESVNSSCNQNSIHG